MFVRKMGHAGAVSRVLPIIVAHAAAKGLPDAWLPAKDEPLLECGGLTASKRAAGVTHLILLCVKKDC